MNQQPEGKATISDLVPASLKHRIVTAANKAKISGIEWRKQAYHEKLARERDRE